MALEHCEVRLIPKEDFMKLVFSTKEVSVVMLKALAAQLEQTETQLLKVAYDAVRQKVASALKAASVAFNVNDEIRINLLREDLAAMAGIAKETLIRTLSEFKDDGLVEIEGNDIVISAPDKLDRYLH
jgi:CRP-like cAMP-binding protein